MAFESSSSRTLKYAVSAGLAKRKKITALLIFWLKTEKIRSTDLYGAPLEGSTIFSKSQLYMPYVNGKLSIS